MILNASIPETKLDAALTTKLNLGTVDVSRFTTTTATNSKRMVVFEANTAGPTVYTMPINSTGNVTLDSGSVGSS